MSSVPTAIADDERLGNRISGKKLRRRGKLRANDWIPRPKEKGKSVDRLDHCGPAVLTRIAARDTARENRRRAPQTPKQFLGWASVRAQLLRAHAIRTEPRPLFRNPYHAELFYPDREATQEETQDARRDRALRIVEETEFLEAVEID